MNDLEAFTDDFILYNNFIHNDKYIGVYDAGNEMFREMASFCREHRERELFQKFCEEIEIWLKVGGPNLFFIAVSLIANLSIIEFKDELMRIKDEIREGKCDLPLYYIGHIEDQCKKFD